MNQYDYNSNYIGLEVKIYIKDVNTNQALLVMHIKFI